MDDAEFEDRLRRSDFLSGALFQVIEGTSLLYFSLVDHLLVSGRLTEADAKEIDRKLRGLVTDLDPCDLVRFTVEEALSDIHAAFSGDAFPALRERWKQHQQEADFDAPRSPTSGASDGLRRRNFEPE